MMKGKIIGFYSLANAVTCFGLLSALASCVLAFWGYMPLAMTLFALAGLCDLFDGALARKTKRTDTEKAYGIQLDSLADCVSFGVAPVLISYAYGFDAWWSLVLYAVYIVHAVVRLAYFNVTADVAEGKTTYYCGVPVTYAALFFPVCMLFKNQIVNAVFFAAMGELFVIKLKIPKPGGIWYVLFPCIAVGLVIVWWLI